MCFVGQRDHGCCEGERAFVPKKEKREWGVQKYAQGDNLPRAIGWEKERGWILWFFSKKWGSNTRVLEFPGFPWIETWGLCSTPKEESCKQPWGQTVWIEHEWRGTGRNFSYFLEHTFEIWHYLSGDNRVRRHFLASPPLSIDKETPAKGSYPWPTCFKYHSLVLWSYWHSGSNLHQSQYGETLSQRTSASPATPGSCSLEC